MWIETDCANMFTLNKLVTPHTGVWIETLVVCHICNVVMSRPTRACGLKQAYIKSAKERERVTPHTGVWIET